MSQISPPIRILLVAVIGLIAVYMLFLRPKTEEATPAAAAPAATTPVPAKDPNATTSSKPGSAVNQAVRGADNASARADAAAGGAVAETEGGTATAPGTVPGATTTVPATGAATTGTTTTGPSAAPAPVTKETLSRLPKDVRRPVAKHKVLVLLFYNNRSSDDRAVRRALSKVDRFGGQVFVDAHWIKNVSRYQAIARGVDIEQSPTIVVADRNLKAETLVGYVDTETIEQAVVDAIRASGGSLIKNPYFRKLDSVCMSAAQQVHALPQPTSTAGLSAYLTGSLAISADADKKVAAIKPPQKLKGFHGRFQAYGAASTRVVKRAAVKAKSQPAAAMRNLTVQGKRLDKKFVAKNGAHGLSCF